jgi:glycosyltransferase involved in cell wall biosynthesis
LPATPVVTLLNAIDVDHFSPAQRESSDVVQVGLVATYARWKGQDVFLRAAAELVRLNRLATTPVRFSIIGGPIYETAGSQFSRAELVSLAEKLNLRGKVGFIDFQADPVEAYRALDVVVHASTAPEPFGRTIIEAMACGRAVIVSAAGGASELIHDGIDALAVAPGDVTGLAAAIARLANDPELRQRLGAAARKTAVRRFDRRRLGPELLAIYRQYRPVRQSFGTDGNPSHTPAARSSALGGKKVESA